MTLLELVKYLRESVLDDTGGTNVPWYDLVEDDVESAQLRWSNEELTTFINEAQKLAARSAFLIKKSETAFNITVVAGTADYSLNTKIIRLKAIESTATGLPLYPAEYEDYLGIKNWRTKTDTPTHYIIDETDKTIKLVPIPVESDTLTLIYYRLPLTDFSWASNTESSEIPEEYQLQMLDWAASLAYRKDEANTFDPARAAQYAGYFYANFSNTSVYGELRRKRSRGRSVRYGGY